MTKQPEPSGLSLEEAETWDLISHAELNQARARLLRTIAGALALGATVGAMTLAALGGIAILEAL